jgi:predicted Zn-dependent peptidase
VVSEENFLNQREVVKEERRQRVDNQPYARAQLTLDTLATDYRPYDHTVIGSMDDLDAARVEDVSRFYERYYVPNNATLTVVGDVTVDQVREMVREYFADIPRGSTGPTLPDLPPVPRTDGERRRVVDDPLAQLPLIYMAYNIPPAGHQDQYALQLLSSVFSEGESSRLHQRLVKEEQVAPTVLSFLDRRKGPGLFYFGSLPNPGGDIDEIEGLISQEIEKLKTEGITAQELRKAKNQRWSSDVTGRLTVSSKASDLQWYRFYHGDPFRINEDLERFEAVTLADVQEVARKYLVPENRTVVVARPTGGSASGQEGAGEEGEGTEEEVNR